MRSSTTSGLVMRSTRWSPRRTEPQLMSAVTPSATLVTHRWVVTDPHSQPRLRFAAQTRCGRPPPVETNRRTSSSLPDSSNAHAQVPAHGDLDVLATPRLITWCENAAFQVCKQNIDADHTTVGTMVRLEHVKGSAVGSEITVLCAEPINDGRRLVCHVTVKDSDGEEIAKGEFHRAVVDPDRFMSKCQRVH